MGEGLIGTSFALGLLSLGAGILILIVGIIVSIMESKGKVGVKLIYVAGILLLSSFALCSLPNLLS